MLALNIHIYIDVLKIWNFEGNEIISTSYDYFVTMQNNLLMLLSNAGWLSGETYQS